MKTKPTYRAILLKAALLLAIPLFFLPSCKKEDLDPIIKDPPTLEERKRYHKKAVGESANDLLADSNYTHLIVEVLQVQGHEVSQDAMDELLGFLQLRLYKSKGIEIKKRVVSSPGKSQFTLQDIVDFEEANRQIYQSQDTLSIFFFIADGAYIENNNSTNVLGIAYRNTSMALFESNIDKYSGGLTQPSATLLETVVLEHEVGHLMGLVNNGSGMQNTHQDEAHGHHCDNDNCLMYWQAEDGDAIGNLLGSSQPPSLDQNCLNDLKANGGR